MTILAAVITLAFIPAPAQAEVFGLKELDSTFLAADGSPQMQAGSHPFEWVTDLAVNDEVDPELGEVPAGQLRNLRIDLPPGLIGAPSATPRCLGVDFATMRSVEGVPIPGCSNSSVVGRVEVTGATALGVTVVTGAPLYNLVPPPGVVAKFGFQPAVGAAVTVEARLEETPPYKVILTVTNATQSARFFSAHTIVWGNPSDPSHDEERGECGASIKEGLVSGKIEGICPTSGPNRPFLTLPRACTGPLETLFSAESWLGDDAAPPPVLSHDDSEPPQPLGIGGCAKLGFAPRVTAQPTSHSAASASGLAVDLDVSDAGLENPAGIANSDIKKAELTLPEGVTINPSQAEGLEVCSEADLAREHAGSEFGAGCPSASKVGFVEAETPLLDGTVLKGSLFVAKPFENPFGTLIALYMTVKEPQLGVGVKLAGKITPDPKTGQLVATFGEPGQEIPQVPLSHVRVRLREGGRSPLITPPLCGTYTSEAKLTPWANPQSPLSTSSSFAIDSGIGGGPCPAPGTPPFEPGFEAGTLNNDAGSYSPFYMRLTRRDGDQDLTKFSATLPRGMVAKLAGLSRCPDAQIALAKSKTGRAELASPSCPATSEIGHVIAGAGVGSQLVYVPGKVYLAGPYNGAPLSVVAVVPAVAGPFDVGTVLTRQALVIDPRTAEVRVDGDRSDPIPHILAGIPLSVRDIRVYVDRPEFTLNPTSCDPAAIGARLWGGGTDVFSTADDSPVSREERFQAAGCAGLGFKPKLSLRLKGGTKRGGHPALTGTYAPRAGDANLAGLVLRFPHATFLDQAHIRTICTRVQFAAKACPAGAVYGHATAYTPLLDEPLSGPVILRSSNHNLPDFVADLHGLIDVEAVARIDSAKGGIRATFSEVPDAPLTKVVVQMQGAKKGLIVNSTDLCQGAHRATASLSAHNGVGATLRPGLRPGCGKGSSRARRHR